MLGKNWKHLPDLRYYCWMQPWKRKCQSFPNHCLPRCSCSSCPSSSSSTASARCSSSQSGSTSSTRAYTTQRYTYFIEYYTCIYSSNLKEQQVIPFVQLTHSETLFVLLLPVQFHPTSPTAHEADSQSSNSIKQEAAPTDPHNKINRHGEMPKIA